MHPTIDPTAILNRLPARGYLYRDPCRLAHLRHTNIGADTAIGAYVIVYRGATIGARCFLADGVKVREGVTIGDDVRLHWDVTVNYDARIGDGTTIGTGSHITGGMVIGKRCFFGAGVMTANDVEPRAGYDAARINPPIVGDDVLIGTGAILLPGVRVGDGATIGAGAIVSEDVPAGATVAGVRGKRIPVTRALADDAGFGVAAPTVPTTIALSATCSRCGAPANNVTPGYSVVAGGHLVCPTCLRPGEELLRVRGVE
jgi:acetyltransferase-like isoleucine patch superfamily enzyme